MIAQLLCIVLFSVSYIQTMPTVHIAVEPDQAILVYSDRSVPEEDSHNSYDYQLEVEDFITTNIPLFETNEISDNSDEDESSKMKICMELHSFIQFYDENYGLFDENDVALLKEITASLCDSRK